MDSNIACKYSLYIHKIERGASSVARSTHEGLRIAL